MRWTGGIVFAIALSLASSACASHAPLPILGGGPGREADPQVFDDAIRSAQSLAYQPLQLDPEHGRFVVLARGDRSGTTHFRVQCFREGFVSVVPEGPTIDRVGDAVRIEGHLRDEYLRFATAIANGVTVRP